MRLIVLPYSLDVLEAGLRSLSVGDGMGIRLIGNDGSRHYSFDLSVGTHEVGRRPDCALSISDKTVSRSHALVTVFSDGRVEVVDSNSHNGTFLNGQRLSAPAPIQVNDQITFGLVEFQVVGSGEESQSQPRPTQTAKLTDAAIEKSVVLSLNEMLKPLPARVTELPDLFPTLSDMARMLILPEPREHMLNRSLTLLAKVIPAERLAVLFTTEVPGEIQAVATLLTKGKDPGSFTLSRTIVNEILHQKTAVLMGSPQEEKFAEQQSIIQLELKSAMAAPLLDEERVLGILYVDTTNPLHRYTQEYVRLLATFGNIIASRLVNYTVLAERQERQLIAAEMRRASAIQRALLVTSSPEISGYCLQAHQEPCLTVGGDLYDMAELSDGRLLFLVGDVSGKGLGAALLMSNILASFRILYKQPNFDLLQAVEQVNGQLCRFSAPNDFATLFIGVLDRATHQVQFVNAGHNPPLVVRADGTVSYLQASGPMIGAFTFSTWQTESVSIGAGDLLLMYSDGVTEAQHQEDLYGEARMEAVVTAGRSEHPARLVDKLVTDIQQFVDDHPRSDDITLMLLKRDW